MLQHAAQLERTIGKNKSDEQRFGVLPRSSEEKQSTLCRRIRGFVTPSDVKLEIGNIKGLV
jgi:hypothetical protein